MILPEWGYHIIAWREHHDFKARQYRAFKILLCKKAITYVSMTF